MSGSEEFTLAVLVLAPLTILALFGMARGYHMHLKVWKHDVRQNLNEEDEHGND